MKEVSETFRVMSSSGECQGYECKVDMEAGRSFIEQVTFEWRAKE
jgi:hypothetical protein